MKNYKIELSNLIFSVAFSPDGSKIIIGSSDFSIQVWSALTFK